jgi:hypothetical protein
LPDRRLLALTQERGLLLCHPQTSAVVAPTAQAAPARVAALTPDARHAFTGSGSSIERWTIGARVEAAGTMPTAGPVAALACGTDGATLYSSEGTTLRARDATTGAVLWERSCRRPASSLWLMADSSRLVSGHDDGTVSLWHHADGRRTMTWTVGGHPIRAIVGDPKGRWLAVGETARITLLRTELEHDGFGPRLAQADTVTATHLDEALRRDLLLRADVLTAIDRLTDLDAGLREIMRRVERLRPSWTWETMAGLYGVSLSPGRSVSEYETALRVAETALAEGRVSLLSSAVAALASLRLGRFGDGLRHCDVVLTTHGRRSEAAALRHAMRAVRVMSLFGMQRSDEARADLLVLQQALAQEANPDVDDLRLLREAERRGAK